MYWDGNSPVKKKCQKWVAEMIYRERQVTYNLKKSKETQCATNILCDKKKSN